MEFNNLTDLLTKFRDEKTCIEHLAFQRWENGIPVCPYCKNVGAYNIEDGKRYKCKYKECHKKFSVRVGTIFEDSNISLRIWFGAIYLATSHKKGISSLQLHRDLGITQKTAWFLMQRIREMLKDKDAERMQNPSEADETFIGGKEKNKHQHKRSKGTQGRSTKTKQAVFGILERDNKVVVAHVPDTSAESLQPIIYERVEAGAIINTDEWTGYNGLNEIYKHQIVNHGRGEYVTGNSHTNTLEGFWSLLKRGIYGIYHQVSPKHLERYCEEFAYRYNTRRMKDSKRFNHALKQSSGRLSYNQLVFEEKREWKVKENKFNDMILFVRLMSAHIPD